MAYDTFIGLPVDQSIAGAAWDSGGLTWGTHTYLAGNGADAVKISNLPSGFSVIGNALAPVDSVGSAVFFVAGAGRPTTTHACTVMMQGDGAVSSQYGLQGIIARVGAYSALQCVNMNGNALTEIGGVSLSATQEYCLEVSRTPNANRREYVAKLYQASGGVRGPLLFTTPPLTITTERPTTARMLQIHKGGADAIAFNRVETLDAPAADITAPTLTNPVATATGANSAGGTVITNEGDGTLYHLVNSGSSATAVQVKAGSSKAVTAAGSQSVTASGLTAATTYRIHYLHRDAAGNDSAVVSTAQFTTEDAPPAGDTTPPVLFVPAASATGPSSAIGSVATDEAGGLLYRFASIAATGVTAAQIKAANLVQTVEATGSQDVIFTGLTPSTTYYAYYLQRDAAGNDSAIARSSAFTTQAAPANGTVSADFPLAWEIQAAKPPDAAFIRSKVRTINIKAAPLTFEGGPYWNLANPRRPVAVIDPNATIDVTFNWTELLADIEDEIASVQFDLNGLSNKGAYREGAFATIFVSDATGSPHITCRITTASVPPRVEDRTVYFNVEQQ